MADKFINLNNGLTAIKTWVTGLLANKQDTLVSGTNIKTVNNNSLLGSGNIDIGGDEDVFIATPNTTIYTDLLAALNSNKAIYVKKSTGSIFATIAAGNQAGTISLITNEAFGATVLRYVRYRVDATNQWTEQQYNYPEEWDFFDDVPTTGSAKWVTSDGIRTYVDTKVDGLENTAESIEINANGQLTVGGRLGQFPDGGVFYPTTIEPTNVGGSTFMMTDGAKNLSLGPRTFGIMAGASVTCKSASAGATQYRLSNTQSNRFACFAGKNGRLALSQADAQTNGTALITNISFANGNPISAYFGATESSNDIIITVDRTVNPSASTTTLRIYGTSTSSDVIVVGQGCGAAGGKAISLGQSCFVGGNQCIAFGNSSISTGNNSVAFGHTHLVNKQFCFAAGQGHDFTNASNGSGAVGIASLMDSNTAFAVGNGVFNANGNITRSNAFEVLKDGSIVLPSPNGTRYKISVDNNGNLSTTAL